MTAGRTQVESPGRMALRVAIAAAATAGLCLHLLNLGFVGWLSTTGAAGVLGVDARLMAPTVIRILAWGVGFSVLALVMVWRIGHRYDVLIAALFLASYALWGGLTEAVPLSSEPWTPAALILLDGLTHAVGVRFTQLFPRSLRREDLTTLGPGWMRRGVMPVLAALLDRRAFWTFAVLLEGGRQLLPDGPGLVGAHILLWVILAATYLYASYARGSADDRHRIFWIFEGVVVFVAAQTVFMLFWAVGRSGLIPLDLTLWSAWLWAVTAWITLACFYLAVFYSGAFDSALVLRRTTVLSASSALAVLIFVVLETVLEEVLADVLGFESRAGAVVAGLVAGLTFHPLSVRIDRRVRRWFAAPTGKRPPVTE